MIFTDVSEMNIDLFGSFRDARACAKKAMIPLSRYGNEGNLIQLLFSLQVLHQAIIDVLKKEIE